jgi:uncharacterized protein YcbK (DUF882 family)
MTDFHKKQISQLDQSTGGYWKNVLHPDHRPILEEGISELARGNPRELKRLLNSALLRGRAAADNPVLRKKNKSAPLFAQGVQFFLVQKIVERWFGRSSNLLLKTPVLDWFQQWSVFVQANPGFRHTKPEQPEERDIPTMFNALANFSPLQHEIEAGFKVISDVLLRHDDGKPVGKQLLFDEELLWKLLLIPFSAEVAQSAPNLELPKPGPAAASAPPSRESIGQPDAVGALSDLVRGRIARAVVKSVDQLTISDLAAVKELNLFFSDVVDADLVALDKLTTLQLINLGGTQITDAGLMRLEKLTALQSLFLNDTVITDAGLKTLEKLIALQDLDMRRTQITDVGLMRLEKLTALQTLYVSRTKITDAGLKTLEKLTALQALDISRTKITDAGMKSLEMLTALEELNLRGTKITDAGVKSLEKLTALEELNLRDTKVTDAGLKTLEKLTALQDLNLSDTKITDAGLTTLEKLTALQALDMRRSKITNVGLKTLEKLTALKTLYLSDTNITDAGLAELKKQLPETKIYR